MKIRINISIVIFFILVFIFLPSVSFADTYKIIDIGNDSYSSLARSINDKDQVVGESNLLPSSLPNCFTWDQGITTNITGLSGAFDNACVGQDINNQGQVIGYNQNYEQTGFTRAFLWQNGFTNDFLGLPRNFTSQPTSINDSGQIVGEFDVPSDPNAPQSFIPRGFVWQNGSMIQLPCQALAVDNNNKGQVIARNESKCNSIDHFYHGLLWDNGVLTNLDFDPIAINNNSQILGVQYVNGGNSHNVVIWQNGNISTLNVPFYPISMNDNEQIVGRLQGNGNFNDRAELWDNGTTTDLGTLPGASGAGAFYINNNADIVGFSFVPNGDPGQAHAVVWENVPVNKDQCKNDGWKNFSSIKFKNQGECIKSVK